MKTERSLGIVLINYFNDEEVIGFIRAQLFRQTHNEIKIYLLNNGSNDSNQLKMFCLSEKRIQYFDTGENLGYIGGFLFVFEMIKSACPYWLILSNSDIEFASLDLLENISVKSIDEDVAIMGPSVISSRTHHNQNPFYDKRISIRRLRLLSIVFSNYFTYFLYQCLGLLKSIFKRNAIKHVEQDSRTVYSVHGSFMIVKSEFIEKYFDELKDAPYLFGEEIQLAEVAFSHRLKTLFVPELKIIHHEHATTKLFKSKKMLKMLKDSIDFRLRKRRVQC